MFLCIFCDHSVFVKSVWLRKWNNDFPYSYLCYCTNRNCKEHLIKFRKLGKRPPTNY